MDAVLLCMKKRGIRFFHRITFNKTDIHKHRTKYSFLRELSKRTECYDNVLIMAHGANDAIIIPTGDFDQPWSKYIAGSDCNAFKNDFVFAVSCYTANSFGKKCIDAGSLCYLGYEVLIGSLFSVKELEKSTIPKRTTIAIDTIIKHIFIEELARAYEEFLMTPINVLTLKERFAFLLERRVAELPSMSSEELFKKYNVRINPQHIDKYIAAVVIKVLEFLSEISNHLVCIGDANYISSSFISYAKATGTSRDEIIAYLIRNPSYQRLKNKEYKTFLLEKASFLET